MKTLPLHPRYSEFFSVYLLFALIVVFPSCKKQPVKENLRPRVQAPVPEGWKELPFIDEAPLPALTEAEKKRSFLLFHRPIVEPVYKATKPRPYERCDEVRGFATLGEFEPLTISIYPADSLKNLRVDISALRNGRHVIDRSNLDVRLVTYWDMPYPYWITKGTYRNVPELLEKVTVNDVAPFVCQRYWVTVHVPRDAKPGVYKGHISIRHDGLNKTVEVPVRFKVLGFILKKDPNKHFSAYFGSPDREYKGLSGELYERAVNNELQSMLDHGFDMTPTMSIFYKDGRITFGEKNEALLKRMIKMGFKGPIPMDGESVVAPLLEETEGISRKPHWRIEKLPSDVFYNKLTSLLKTFKKEWDEKGWPDFYLNPVDEVDPTAKTFGIGVFKATKAAGIKTYITKSSTSPGAMDYGPYINAWCSQPYDVPYEKAISGDFEYWSYPNHNAGERKNRLIMMKGGRMTYGYGFWRSGYTVLIPWHWRWIVSDDQFNYFGRVAPCGMRMDENGEIVPAIYWECFREGYDDLRYLYTLEQAITERKGSAGCREIIRESENLLQLIWNSIEPQQLYLKTGMWPSEEFQNLRWRIAQQIAKLLQCPVENDDVAPSVLAVIDTKPGNCDEKNTTGPEPIKWSKDKVEIFDLGTDNFSRWKNLTKEGSIKVIKKSGKPALRFTVRIDHEKDGEYDDGRSPIGWPRIELEFKNGAFDLPAYDYLHFYLTVRSNRDEIADNKTVFVINLECNDNRIKEDINMDLGDVEGQRVPIEISIPEMLNASFYDADSWRHLRFIRFVLPERPYMNGTVMNLTFEQVYFLKFNVPVITKVDVPDYVLLSSKWLKIKAEGYGFDRGGQEGFVMDIELLDPSGRRVTSVVHKFEEGPDAVLEISEVKDPGQYALLLDIKDQPGNVTGSLKRKIQFIETY